MLVNDCHRASGSSAGALLRLFQHPDLKAQQLNLLAGEILRHGPNCVSESIYMIVSGQVWIYQLGADAHSRLAEIAGPGEWFGAASLVALGESHWEGVLPVDSCLVEAPAEQFLNLLPSHPQAASELIHNLVLKLRSARDDAARMMFDDCNLRLLKTLLRFSDSAAASRCGNEVVLRITHQQLGHAIGAARETVSLALTDLRRQNLLRTGRNQLFYDPDIIRGFMTHSAQDRAASMARCA